MPRHPAPCPSVRAALLPGLVLAALLSGCEKAPDNEAAAPASAPPAKVKTTRVDTRLFTDQVEALGTVRAREAIDLSANVTDRVAEVAFEDGDRVEKGDLLIRLEDAEENAMLEGAKAGLAEQEREIKRLESLVAEGAVSEVRLEEYRTRRDVARQRVEEAQAQIADRRIIAPFDGVLGFRRVSVGALVTPGDLIATLDILDPVKLDFTVPETFLNDLKPGQEITAITEAYPGESFTGEVTRIDTRVNLVTRSITVRAEIPNPDHRLRPGMLMTTTLRKNPRESLSIPERSLVSVQANHFAYVVEGTNARRATVTIGRRVPGYVEIIEGLEAGETVVTDGLLGLTDGAVVEVIGEFESPAEPYSPSGVSH